MALLEASLERKFRKEVKNRGGKAIKFSLLINWPDRLILWPNGTVEWVELKAPGKKARKGQNGVHNWLRRMNFKVCVISNKEELEIWLKNLEKYQS